MNPRYVIARLLETFFARWWLYLLPLVALVGLGVYTAGSQTDTYRSSAVLRATDPLLGQLQEVSLADTQWWESPADAASRGINESLRTDAFVQAVVADTGIAIETLMLGFDDIRQSVWASASGRTLVSVNASTVDPVLAQALVKSTIKTYQESLVGDQISEATTTLKFLEDQRVRQEQAVQDAADELNAYMDGNPPDAQGDRTAEQLLQIERLNARIATADERLSETLDDIQAAELVIQQATSEASQTLRVVDDATVPFGPETGLRKVVMTVATFAALGLLLMVGAVVAASLLDRSLRFAEEVRSSLGVEVLAVIPVERRGGRGRRRRGAVT
jgi:uncharacterized protein involved in exopolysaccharide biosynthesis